MRSREVLLGLTLLVASSARAETPHIPMNVPLDKGWHEVDNKNAPRSFQRAPTGGVLQVTGYARTPDGMPTNGKDLTADLRYFVHLSGLDSVHPAVFTAGKCAFGRYAKAVARGPEQKGEILWLASDSTRSMLATFGYDETPSADELATAEAIVLRATAAK